MRPVLFLLVLFFLVQNPLLANQKTEQTSNDTTYIHLADYGLEKTKKRDCVRIIKRALKDLEGTTPKKLIFKRGTYHFYPEHCERRHYYESNTTDENPRRCAFLFEGAENLVIEGNGSMLIFHEQMQPFTFDQCKNIVLQNIRIDWDQPLIAQAEVLKVDNEYIEVGMNLKESPFRVEKGKILFNQGKWGRNPWKGTMEFDRNGKYVVPQTGDRGCLGRGWQDYLAENIIPGVLRINFPFLRKPAVGNFLVMRHAERIHSGIFIQDSKNIRVKNLDLYHATGLGILAQYSEDLSFDGYRAIPNKAKRRYFGGGDDGLQVSNCKGLISLNNCEFAGLMDDPINVHGTSVRIEKILSTRKLKCKFMHHQSVGMTWGHPGDEVSFIENEEMFSLGSGKVKSFEKINAEHFVLTFQSDIPSSLEEGDALENLTWSPDVSIRNTHFKSCRARGVLISTPGQVIIENNIFESSGSAILIAGDANGWYESGAVKDVLIRNNVFTDLCNTSSYQFCEGIISIYPIIPVLDEQTPAFHRNIRIENNDFNPADYPVLYAKSVNGLSFTDNKVTRSTRFEPYHRRKFTLSFEACQQVNVSGNTYSEDVLGKNIELITMDESDIKCLDELNIQKRVKR